MEEKSEPNRFLIILLFLLFGVLSGMIVVLFRFYFLKEKNVLEKISS